MNVYIQHFYVNYEKISYGSAIASSVLLKPVTLDCIVNLILGYDHGPALHTP